MAELTEGSKVDHGSKVDYNSVITVPPSMSLLRKEDISNWHLSLHLRLLLAPQLNLRSVNLSYKNTVEPLHAFILIRHIHPHLTTNRV